MHGPEVSDDIWFVWVWVMLLGGVLGFGALGRIRRPTGRKRHHYHDGDEDEGLGRNPFFNKWFSIGLEQQDQLPNADDVASLHDPPATPWAFEDNVNFVEVLTLIIVSQASNASNTLSTPQNWAACSVISSSSIL
ncbi:hypothetical protein CVT26_009579 [Gymnopilus dilepis]|uniref:Uncharacterized protein n=1 Tax=Gymnopilus dilepis TaxID=231916 RepID=A0A409WUJ9_9AGAR|nr:hypothetical protein CVT26_009579 [Gymnopilus dilepis]